MRTAGLEANGLVYVRPHDIVVGRAEPGRPGLPAVVRHVHAAGAQARLVLESVRTREPVEAELSRVALEELALRANDLVRVQLRQAHSFETDYAI